LERYKKELLLVHYILKALTIYREIKTTLMLPTLTCRRLYGDTIDVFKIVNNFYNLKAAVKLNFNMYSQYN